MFPYIVAGISAALAVIMAIILVVQSGQHGKEKSAAQQAQHRAAEAEGRLADLEQQLVRYRAITDIEAVLAQTRATITSERQRGEHELAQRRAQAEADAAQMQAHLQQLGNQQGQLEHQLAYMRAELSYLDERALFEANGLYENHYDFDTAEQYKARLDRLVDQQKSMVKGELAAICRTTWTVEGSAAKGAKMTKDQLKLMLRAFNGECDGALAKVKYNNIESLEKRITRAFAAINKLGAVNQYEITEPYFSLKLEELRLVHEYKEKLQAEREEQRMIREQMRDEERAQKELEKAQKDAEGEERKLEAAIAKAQQQAEASAGKRHDQLVAKLEALQAELTQALERKQRAISRAQLTRSGHVYVISNIGSFGEHVYKIGMTRRLEPLDRVKELGDASVPFRFDVHAMIYTEDAPALEAKLHARFSERQVNLVNSRKEFFAVELGEIEAAVRSLHGDISFVKTAAAEEFRKSQAMRVRQTRGPRPNHAPGEFAATALH
ncbi:DUF4041 domain-containing protein [Pseudenhygromyxa sp. WMMC2535]|uniref:DUF4041 domain-containing protein n=1 Tax=Pseudenhygromyxa sp. WMMC2535 TaxID=2712867 RepID=UPI0015574031|nr:DUF4041 domain-containing protein [Pseudenhygromyxa sp. WMMC2535]NVB40830.1 DUF4041 domain-containing protein [Pseudenhygromyxa sp. WMMC2535]